MPVVLSDPQSRLLRLKSNRLMPVAHRPAETAAQVVRAVVGIQAQDLPAALLSIRARSPGLTTDQIDQARLSDRSILWTWCLRGTLHLLAAEDAAWLIPFLGPVLIAGDRLRMAQLGWDDAGAVQGLRLVQAVLEEKGALTREEVVNLLRANHLPHQGQAPVHLLFRAALEGLICYGPLRNNKAAYVLFEAWAGELRPLPREEALTGLARRYLAAYAPAGASDLAGWSGIKLGEAREAFQLIQDEIVPVEAAGRPMGMLKVQMPWLDDPQPSTPLVHLLPRFDTFLLGYASRDLTVEPAYAKRVNAGGGIIHPTVLVDGQAVGTWKTVRRGKQMEIHIDPFESLPAELSPYIEAEAAEIARFLGLPVQ
jgi:hypothetical protein